MREIDFVFLWVNANDPLWQKKRDDFIATRKDIPADSFLPIHFTNHDELRFAIRSVEKFAPFFRKIFLVTDQQKPAWLQENARCVVVDHRDFFASDTANPVFSPDAIESQLHRIPGLSEYFVYANDDMFLARPVTPDDFFTEDGSLVARMSPQRVKIPRPDDIKWLWIWYNAALALSKAFGDFYRPLGREKVSQSPVDDFADLPWNYIDHQMLPLRKSVCQSAENFFDTEFRYIRAQQYRSRKGIAPLALFYYWAIHEQLAKVAVDSESLYIDTPRLDAAFRSQLEKLLLPVEQRPKFFCLNDNAPADTAQEIYAIALHALAQLLPSQSSFEDASKV